MIEIRNPWYAKGQVKYYKVENPCFEYGRTKVYKQNTNCFLYTLDDKAVAQLAGLNRVFARALSEGIEPLKVSDRRLFNRAMETYNRNLKMDGLNEKKRI